MERQEEPIKAEVLSPSTDVALAVGLTKAEVDQQIATAHQFPRSIKKAMGNIISMATLDEETAEECMYSLPRDGKTIEGPSSRFAELVAQSWGNCRVAARVVREERDYIVAQAVYHDLETNTAISTEVQRRIIGRGGRRYSPDMIVTTGNAACSIARRNIILAGVPRAAWRKAYDSARQVIMGDVETLANRRANALKAFLRYGIAADQIYAALRVAGEEEITLDHLVTLRSMLATLKNGEATPEEMFAPVQRSQTKTDPDYNPLVDKDADKPTADSAGGQPANTQSVDATSDRSPPPGNHADNERAGDSPAPSSQAASGTYDYKAYSLALMRAEQKRSLGTFDSEFRNKNGWCTDDAALPTMRKIYEVHLRRVEGALKVDAVNAALKELGVSL